MTTRYRANFYSGLATVPSTGSLTISGTGFPNLSIPAGQYMAITLNPGYYGATSNAEIVYIGPTTTSGLAQVIKRGAEGTIAITGTNIPWVAGPTPTDFDVSNLTATGTLSLSGTGGLNVSGTINTQYLNVNNSGTISYGSGVGVYNVPFGRMYAAAPTAISGSSYTNITTVATGTYGFTNGGVTFSGSKLVVPTAGYYQINASIGFSSNTNSAPLSAGIYGIQIAVYNASSIYANYYVAANNYLAPSGTIGLYPETIVLSDIIYLNAGYSVNLIGYNAAASGTFVYTGSGTSGPQTTYLSLSYIGS
jgi:hypothetical protein